MRLAVLGGSGGIGAHLLTWALDHGHDVQALARDPHSLDRFRQPVATPGRAPGAGQLTVTTGDALDPAAVADVVAGTDAVLSGLGPRGARSPALLAGAATNITAAMAQTGARRLICVSAAGAFVRQDPDAGLLIKAVLPLVFGQVFADTQQMEAVIRATSLDWTLVRATRLVNTPATGRYRVRPDYPPAKGRSIARADVARFMASALTDDNWVRAAPALAY
jgi:putative NADH-flavin reductase